MSLITMTLIITTSLARVEASGSLLERLLKTTLEAASCHARCDGLTTEDLEDCLDVCSLVSQNPQTSICQFPRFCTGGCRAACDTERPEEEAARLSSVSQDECQLSWHIQSPHSKVVFVVAGLDQGGKLSLVSSLEEETRLELSTADTSKYVELTVLAVDRRGLTHTKSVSVRPIAECPRAPQVTLEKLEQFSLGAVHIAVIASLLVLVVFFIIFFFISRKKVKTIGGQEDNSHAFLLTKEDFLYDDQSNEKYTFF